MKNILLFFLILIFFANTAYSIEEKLYPTLLKVKYREGLIIINFEPLEDRAITYRIYRAYEPISTIASLISAELVAEIESNDIPYSDSPGVDGKYAYAVTIVKNGKEHLNLIPFQNITINPVAYAPSPKGVEKIDIRQKDRNKVEISFEPVNPDYSYNLYVSQEKVSHISDQKPYSTLRGKNYFSVSLEEDTPYQFIITVSNSLGVENKTIIWGKNANQKLYVIKSVKKEKPVKVVKEKTNRELIEHNLRYNFYKGKYRTALGVFLSIRRKQNLTVSEMGLVHFYMGQCYYYLDKNSKAIKYFILAKEQKEYSSQSDAWIERCLEN